MFVDRPLEEHLAAHDRSSGDLAVDNAPEDPKVDVTHV